MTAGNGEATRIGVELTVAPRVVEVSVRKFADYVLVPGQQSGKDRIFVGRLGFRPRNLDDARFLVDLYLARARQAMAAGDYTPGESDEYGDRCIIIVSVRGVAVRSVWLLGPNGVFELVTPFSGFSRRPPKD